MKNIAGALWGIVSVEMSLSVKITTNDCAQSVRRKESMYEYIMACKGTNRIMEGNNKWQEILK